MKYKARLFQLSRPAALAELQEETRRIYRERQKGQISLKDAEEQLEGLAVKYETPFDRLIAS